ncbi:unnamed protein product [Oikopleura dioica]|uniref:SET domain-containing protein n=1 Tax=Oikopleura dioica TaxID=34765 RepID=E4Z4I7_OIKDI|nr:unnamed protein product [Oikopleura dioica]
MNISLKILDNLRESYGIFISDKLKISDGDCGRGVFSSAVIEQSELLISVPIDALLTTRKAQHVVESHKSARQVLQNFSTCLNGTDLLVCALFLELETGENSKWTAFLSSIPKQLWNPFMLDEKELNLLTAKCRLPSKCLKQKIKISTEFLKALGFEINEEILSWCFSVVLSRSFGGSPERCQTRNHFKIEVDNSANFCLCPAIDLINHEKEYNCEYRWNENKTAFQVFSRKKILQGQELFVNYGTTKSEYEIYSFYGFILPSDNFQVEFELQRIRKSIYDDKKIDFLTSQLDMVFAMEKLESSHYFITSLKVSADLRRLANRVGQIIEKEEEKIISQILLERFIKNKNQNNNLASAENRVIEVFLDCKASEKKNSEGIKTKSLISFSDLTRNS